MIRNPKTGKKFVSLSNASLCKIWNWCEGNRGDPLELAYVGACNALGTIDCSKISGRLKRSWPNADDTKGRRWGHWIISAHELDDLAFMHRDTIGRTILGVIKREGGK